MNKADLLAKHILSKITDKKPPSLKVVEELVGILKKMTEEIQDNPNLVELYMFCVEHYNGESNPFEDDNLVPFLVVGDFSYPSATVMELINEISELIKKIIENKINVMSVSDKSILSMMDQIADTYYLIDVQKKLESNYIETKKKRMNSRN